VAAPRVAGRRALLLLCFGGLPGGAVVVVAVVVAVVVVVAVAVVAVAGAVAAVAAVAVAIAVAVAVVVVRRPGSLSRGRRRRRRALLQVVRARSYLPSFLVFLLFRFFLLYLSCHFYIICCVLFVPICSSPLFSSLRFGCPPCRFYSYLLRSYRLLRFSLRLSFCFYVFSSIVFKLLPLSFLPFPFLILSSPAVQRGSSRSRHSRSVVEAAGSCRRRRR
jgi:hypothetical protein